MKTVALFLVGLLALGVASAADAASLAGATLQVGRVRGNSASDLFLITSENVVVGPGQELTDFGADPLLGTPGIYNIDISDTRITVVASGSAPAAGVEDLIFQDIFNALPPFVGEVSINAATNFTGFEPIRLAVSSPIIRLNLAGLAVTQGQQIVIDVFPEPMGATLGLIAIATLCRRRPCGRGEARYCRPPSQQVSQI